MTIDTAPGAATAHAWCGGELVRVLLAIERVAHDIAEIEWRYGPNPDIAAAWTQYGELRSGVLHQLREWAAWPPTAH